MVNKYHRKMVRTREFLSPLSLNVITGVRYIQTTVELSGPNLQTLIHANNSFTEGMSEIHRLSCNTG
jgi:hypothetical protein